MHRVAILKSFSNYDDYDNYSLLIEKITDFTEVDAETFAILTKSQHQYGFKVIEQPIEQEVFIQNTVADYLKMIREAEKKEVERKALAAEQKRLRDLKKKAKTIADQKKLLEDLIKIHGVPEVK